ncbi:MAG: hypothetical protein HKP30_05370 [Myxococcales bacterium]|nr:hypothetical protein [Myxococcales bacterium]
MQRGSEGFEAPGEIEGIDGIEEVGFWSESGGAVLIVCLFVAAGLGWASWLGGTYPAHVMAEVENTTSESPRLFLVDGFNLLHAAVLKGQERADWWRRPARTRVLDLAERFPDRGAEIVVVFDGDDPEDPAGEGAPRVQQVFAPSADEWLVRRVKDTPRGSAVAVVTADRKLAARARHHGAEIVSPRDFAERCREREGSGPGSAAG